MSTSRQYPDVTTTPASYNRAYALSRSVPADDWLFGELLAQLAPQPGWRVLDVGCNTGELTARLAQTRCRVTGIDLNPDAIALAKERFPDLDFRPGTLEQLDATGFDAIVASHVLEHLADPGAFLRAARAKGSKLVLATPNRHAWLRRLAHRLWGVSFFNDPTHVQFFSPPALRQALRQAGFERIVITTRRIYFPLAARLPQRVHLAIPGCGMGDHLLAIAGTAP